MRIGKLSFVILLISGLLLLFIVYNRWGEKNHQRPTGSQTLSITQIAVDPQNSQVLYVATLNAGIFKSLDRGKSWATINQGLKTIMIQDLVIDPRDARLLLAGTFGGGVYRSDDAGSFWTEANDGLSNTTVSQLVFHPLDAGRVYAVSLAGGIFKSSNFGQTWTSMSDEPRFLGSQTNLAFLPVLGNPSIFFLGTNHGLLRSMGEGSDWEALSIGRDDVPEGKQVTSLAYDPRTQILYVGVAFQGIFSSKDKGTTWSFLGKGSDKEVIYSLTFEPSNPKVIYTASTVRGVLKSEDGGTSWTELNDGLEWNAGVEGKPIKTLIRDPRDPETFYAAPLGSGTLFVSTNRGTKWAPLDRGFPTIETVIQAFSAHVEKEAALRTSMSTPKAFKKCYGCHGWTESLLNTTSGSLRSIWRVAPSHRQWDNTVKRMKKMMPDLTPSEEAQIIGFLNAQFGLEKK